MLPSAGGDDFQCQFENNFIVLSCSPKSERFDYN